MNDETKTAVNTSSVAKDIQLKAATIAATIKAKGDRNIAEELGKFHDRKVQNSVSSVLVALNLNHDLDPQTIMSLPNPGTPQVSVDPVTKVKTANQNPDKYDDTEYVNGKAHPLKGSFCWDLALDLGPGAVVVQNQRWISDARKNQAGPDNPYAGLGEQDLDTKTAYWASRKQSITRCMADGIELVKAITYINGTFDDIEVTIRLDEKDPLRPMEGTSEPIKVRDCSNKPNADERMRFMSVPAFLALDTAFMTKENIEKYKSEWATLIQSGKRGKKGDGQSGKGKVSGASNYPPVKTPDNFHDWALSGINYLDAEGDDGVKHQAAIMRMAADAKTGDDWIETLGDLCVSVETFWDTIQTRYWNIKKSKAAAEKPEAKAA